MRLPELMCFSMTFCWKISTEEVLLIARLEEKAFARSLLTACVLLLLVVVVVLRFFALLWLSPSTEEELSDDTDEESSSSTSLLMSSKCNGLLHSHDIPSLEVAEERILAVPCRDVVPSASMIRSALGAPAEAEVGVPPVAVVAAAAGLPLDLVAAAFCWSWLKEVMVVHSIMLRTKELLLS